MRAVLRAMSPALHPENPVCRLLGGLALELATSTDETARAVGLNLLHDLRISKERAAEFYRRTGKPNDAKALLRALVSYQREVIYKQLPSQSYLAPANQENVLWRNGDGSRSSPIPEEFIHVLNVSLTEEWLRPGPRVEEISPGQREAYMIRLIDRLNESRDNRPVWVTDAQAFDAAFKLNDAAGWLAAVGVYAQPGTWIAVLRYPRNRVPAVLRPTQFDSGNNGFHYPSPPIAGSSGWAVDLNGRDALLPEWIHPPIPFTIEDWKKGGQRLGPVVETGGPAWGGLTVARARHRERLLRQLGSAWDQDLP